MSCSHREARQQPQQSQEPFSPALSFRNRQTSPTSQPTSQPCPPPQVGTTVPCQQYLQSSWSVCSNSVVLGTGQGSVAVKLPKPSAVANFTANPRSITSSEDAARLNPLLVATSSRLSLAVAFDDGVVRDFSTDRRVVYGVAQGSMCEVVKGGHMSLGTQSNIVPVLQASVGPRERRFLW